MQNFNSFGQFANHMLHTVQKQYHVEVVSTLEQVGAAVAQEATRSVGYYQSGIGGFPAWAPLAASTLEKKARKGWGLGGNPNSPLYATGKFRQSIGYRVNKQHLMVTIGSNARSVIFTELGTSKMPARPVFVPAALRTLPRYVAPLGASLAGAIAGTRGFRAIGIARNAYYAGDIT